MTTSQILTMLTAFAGGVGLFLYGMHVMAAGLQKTSSAKMKKLLEVLTKNKFLGIIVGTVVTMLIQSSSATTVIVVGFVNAGIMNLTQSVGVIMGANIGTTITSWLVASSEWSKYFSLEKIAPLAVLAGTVMVMFFKKRKITQVGEIIVGFGILFVGISAMSTALSDLRDLQIIQDAFVSFGTNPFLGLLVGMLVTAVIQSSSASVAILQLLAAQGLVPISAAVYIIMGQNIGTCVTAILSSIGASTNAKRAAAIHLLFNVIGSIVFTIAAIVFFTFINETVGALPISKTEIGIVHSAFNIACTIMLYPFSNVLVTLSQKLVREKAPRSKTKTAHLDKRILTTPSFAIESSKIEVLRLAELARENFLDSTNAVLDRNLSKIDKILKKEETIDLLEKDITEYLIKICNEELSAPESNSVTILLHCLTDIERVGDHCENMAEIAQFMNEENVFFSETALEELRELVDLALSCYTHSIEVLDKHSKELCELVIKEEEKTDELVKELRERHIKRLAANECTPISGVSYVDALTNLERMTDHSRNIAESVF